MTADHKFVMAAEVPIDVNDPRIHSGLRTGRMYVNDQMVHVTDAYCTICRQTLIAVFDQPCLAVEDNTHLIGGHPDGSRAKRKHNHDCFAHGCNTAQVVSARQRGSYPDRLRR